MSAEKSFLFFLILAFKLAVLSMESLGFAAAAVPDTIFIEEGGQGTFRILNPNSFDVSYSIQNTELTCEPEKGHISAEKEAQIQCTAATDGWSETIIIVNIADKNGAESIGVIPAVAIRAKREGEREEDAQKAPSDQTETKEGAPLTVEKSEETNDDAEELNIIQLLKRYGEVGTIILLTIAIVGVILLPKRKDREKEKKETDQGASKSNACSDASSRQDAPCGRSSASAEASHDPPSQAPLHDAKARNQQHSLDSLLP
ncbi:hypothetical protein KY362_07330 [Candidatus Woesearchaeota archaeon]|nr:hypothetical protein [Candidatus Woesearchaeota archaeon]